MGSSSPFSLVVLRSRRANAETIESWLAWGRPGQEKLCCSCGESKLVGEFHAKTRWFCGLPRTWQPYCRECQREIVRMRAFDLRRRRGVPQRNGRPYKIREGYDASVKPSHGKDAIPAGPFKRWLEAWIEQRPGYARAGDQVTTLDDLADKAGVSVRFLHRARVQERVSKASVDKVLVSMGIPLSLLYPEH